MANLNKVMLIGRLTREPEIRTFSTGGKVAAFGFAVNNSRKNPQSGQWEDEPVFIDCDAFNRGEGGRQLADLVERYLHKGHQAYLEGRLRLDQWEDKKDGQKRSKLKLVVDQIQLLEPRADTGSGEGSYRGTASRFSPPARQPEPPPDYTQGGDAYEESEPDQQGPSPGKAEDIPF
jgi:single-strand DNA-binding protein